MHEERPHVPLRTSTGSCCTRVTGSDLLACLPPKWTRALFLLPTLLIPLAVMEFGEAVNSNSSLAAVVSALKAPLSSLTDGSPGGRAPGALLSTKPDFAPHERVLSQTRERASANVPAAAELPFTDLPVNQTGSQDQGGAAPSSVNTPFGNDAFSGGIFGYPGFSDFGPGAGGELPNQIQPLANASAPSGTITVPASPDLTPAVRLAVTPPADQLVILPPATDFPGETDLTPPLSPSPDIIPIVSTPLTAVAEPSTWSLMLFGLFFLGTTVRHRLRKQGDLSGPQ